MGDLGYCSLPETLSPLCLLLSLLLASLCTQFEGENAALMPMNPYVTVAWERFKEFFLKASTVESPEVKFGFDEYHDFVMLSKPVIYISVREVCSTHQHLLEHKDRIAPEPTDPLHEVLNQLGQPPTVEEFLGVCVCVSE